MIWNKRLPPFIYWLLFFALVLLFIFLNSLYNQSYAADDISLLADYEDFVPYKTDPLELVRSIWEGGYKPENDTDDYKLYERILELKDMNCNYFSSYLSSNKNEYYMFFTKWPLSITDSGIVRYQSDIEIPDNQDHYAPCIRFSFDDSIDSYVTNLKITNVEFWLLDYQGDSLILKYSSYNVYDTNGDLIYKAIPHWAFGIYFWILVEVLLDCISFSAILKFLALGLGVSGCFFIGWIGVRKLIKMVVGAIRKGRLKF